MYPLRECGTCQLDFEGIVRSAQAHCMQQDVGPVQSSPPPVRMNASASAERTWLRDRNDSHCCSSAEHWPLAVMSGEALVSTTWEYQRLTYWQTVPGAVQFGPARADTGCLSKASYVAQSSKSCSPSQSSPPHCFHSWAMPRQAGAGTSGVSGVSGLSGVSGESVPFVDSGVSGVSGISEVSGATDGLLTSFVKVERVEGSSGVLDVGSSTSVRSVVAMGLTGRATGSSLVAEDDADGDLRVVREGGAEAGSSVSGTSLVLPGLLRTLLDAVADVLEAEVLGTDSSASEAPCDVVSRAGDVSSLVLDGLAVEDGGMVLVLVLVSALVAGSGSASTRVSVSAGSSSMTTVPVSTSSSSSRVAVDLMDVLDVTLLEVGLARSASDSVSASSSSSSSSAEVGLAVMVASTSCEVGVAVSTSRSVLTNVAVSSTVPSSPSLPR